VVNYSAAYCGKKLERVVGNGIFSRETGGLPDHNVRAENGYGCGSVCCTSVESSLWLGEVRTFRHGGRGRSASLYRGLMVVARLSKLRASGVEVTGLEPCMNYRRWQQVLTARKCDLWVLRPARGVVVTEAYCRQELDGRPPLRRSSCS